MCWLLRRTQTLLSGKETSACVPKDSKPNALNSMKSRNTNLIQGRQLNTIFVTLQEVDVKIMIPVPVTERSTQNLTQRKSLQLQALVCCLRS